MRLEWLSQAQNAFEEIIDYIAEDNPLAAIEKGDEIENQVAGLLVNHHHGRPEKVSSSSRVHSCRSWGLWTKSSTPC